MSPARWAAFQVLEKLATSDAHSDDLLHGPLLAGLSQQDTALAHTLVMGTLRWQLSLEDRLLTLLTRPDSHLPSQVENALRLGAFQLLHLDRIPAHAALSESVELVRAAGHPGAAGLVNAILRKLSVNTNPARKPLVESADGLAKRLGHPQWLVRRWVKAYGQSAAEAICTYDLTEPTGGELFADATAFRMDDGSRLVAELAAAAKPDAATVWDTCAAPGGKTSVLAARLPEAKVLATDVSPKRLHRMAQRFEMELPGRIRTLGVDAGRLSEEEGPFDLILCDVPCSGTGTMARNPEIKVRLEPEDLERQTKRQLEIAQAALARLAPGGRLVYSTCSLEPEENEDIVRSLKGAKVVPVAEALDRLHLADTAPLVRGEFLRTLPGVQFAGDGFFAAILERA
ncbi:MAG: transcription antitermination factor NusB [Acidobacteriaceae bacterium]|nr:transcription antitermination factor NusB [Acidobacteriaceae bacterium]